MAAAIPFITLPAGGKTGGWKDGWITYLFSGISWSIEFYIYHLAFLAYRYPAMYYPLYKLNKNNPVLHVFKTPGNYGRSRWQKIELPNADHPLSIVLETGLAGNQSQIVVSPELSALLFSADAHVKQYLDNAVSAGDATVDAESKNFGTLGTYLLHIVKERGAIEYAAQGDFLRLDDAVKQFLCDLTWTYEQETMILIEKPYLHLMTGQSYTAGPLTRTFASLYTALDSFYQSRWADIKAARGKSPAKTTIPASNVSAQALLSNVNHVVQMIDVSRAGVLLPPWQKLSAADRADCDSLILEGEATRLRKWFSMVKGRAADKVPVKKPDGAAKPAKKSKAKSAAAASSADDAPLVKPKSRKKSKRAAAADEEDVLQSLLPLPPDQVPEQPQGPPVLVSKPSGSPMVRDPAPVSVRSDPDDEALYLSMLQAEERLPSDVSDDQVLKGLVAHLWVLTQAKTYLSVRYGVQGVEQPSNAVYAKLLELLAARIHTDPDVAALWIKGFEAGLANEETLPHWLQLFASNVAPYYGDRRLCHLIRPGHTIWGQVFADIDLTIELNKHYTGQALTTDDMDVFYRAVNRNSDDGLHVRAREFVSLVQNYGVMQLLTPTKILSLKIVIRDYYIWLFDKFEALGAAQNVYSLVDLFPQHVHVVYAKVIALLLDLSCYNDLFVLVNVAEELFNAGMEHIIIGQGLIARELIHEPEPAVVPDATAVVPEPTVVVPTKEEQRGTKRVAPSTPEVGELPPTPVQPAYSPAPIPSVRQLLQESPIYEDDPSVPEKAASPAPTDMVVSPQRSFATKEQKEASKRAVGAFYNRAGIEQTKGDASSKRQLGDDEFSNMQFQRRKPNAAVSSSSATAAAAASSSAVVVSHDPAPKIIQDPQASRPRATGAPDVFPLRRPPLRRPTLAGNSGSAASSASASSTATVRRAVDRVKANEPNTSILGRDPQQTVDAGRSAYHSWKRYETDPSFIYDDILRQLAEGADIEQMMDRDLHTQ